MEEYERKASELLRESEQEERKKVNVKVRGTEALTLVPCLMKEISPCISLIAFRLYAIVSSLKAAQVSMTVCTGLSINAFESINTNKSSHVTFPYTFGRTSFSRDLSVSIIRIIVSVSIAAQMRSVVGVSPIKEVVRWWCSY
jgi:hypothetical protein